MWAVLCVCVVAAAGCISPDTTVCSNGAVCPRDTVCNAALGGCVSPGQIEACDGLSDGDDCAVQVTPGICRAGACLVSVCGDGIRVFDEACDDGNTEGGDGCSADCRSAERCGDGVLEAALGEECDCGDEELNADCASLNADAPGGTCRADCILHCGDSIVNAAEDCDTARPLGGCLAFGFDRGPIDCDGVCSFDTSACAEFGVKPSGGPGLADQHILGMYVAPSGDILAVGSQGNVASFDGSSWTAVLMTTPFFFTEFRQVDGSSDTFALAVGAIGNEFVLSGRMLRWDGSAWSFVDGPGAFALDAVWVGSETDFVVSGTTAPAAGSPKVWESDGQDYNEVATVSVVDFADLGGGDVVGVGNGGSVVYRKSGTWTTEIVPGTPDLRGVWAIGPDDIWAVGMAGTIFHRDDTEWTAAESNTSENLHSIVGTGPTNAYAVGESGTVLYFDGDGFFPADSGTDKDLFAAVVRGGEVFYGGESFVTHRSVDGHWGRLSVGVSHDFGPIASGGGSTYVGRFRNLWRWNGQTLEDLGQPGGTINDVTVWSSNHVVVTSGSRVSLWNGGSFADIHVLGGLATRAHYVVAEKRVFVATRPAGGTAGAVHDVTTSGFTSMPLTFTGADDIPNALDGSSATDIYLLTTIGSLRHYDGAEWTEDAQGFGLNNGALFVASATSVFVGNRDGVWHFDGSAWTLMDSEIDQEVVAIHGSSPSDVFALTVEDLYHYNGTSWSPVRRPSVLMQSVVVTAGSVFVGGKDGTFLRLTRPTAW